MGVVEWALDSWEGLMHIATVGAYPLTVGSLIALIVLILAILGLVSAIPFTPTVVFALFAALAVARLT